MGLEISIRPQSTANSQVIAVSSTTVHSTVFPSTQAGMATSAVVTVDTNVYMRMTDSASTTVADDGTDQILLSGNSYRVAPIPEGYYLHFIRVSADGHVYITPQG